jgi:hypothetical protein
MASYNTRSRHRNEGVVPHERLRTSPEPMDAENPSAAAVNGHLERPLSAHEHHSKSGPLPSVVRHSSTPIHHQIAPALGTPFMRADGLVHRGMVIPVLY